MHFSAGASAVQACCGVGPPAMAHRCHPTSKDHKPKGVVPQQMAPRSLGAGQKKSWAGGQRPQCMATARRAQRARLRTPSPRARTRARIPSMASDDRSPTRGATLGHRRRRTALVLCLGVDAGPHLRDRARAATRHGDTDSCAYPRSSPDTASPRSAHHARLIASGHHAKLGRKSRPTKRSAHGRMHACAAAPRGARRDLGRRFFVEAQREVQCVLARQGRVRGDPGLHAHPPPSQPSAQPHANAFTNRPEPHNPTPCFL